MRRCYYSVVGAALQYLVVLFGASSTGRRERLYMFCILGANVHGALVYSHGVSGDPLAITVSRRESRPRRCRARVSWSEADYRAARVSREIETRSAGGE